MANVAVDATVVIEELSNRCGQLIRENAILTIQVKQLSQQVDDLLESADEEANGQRDVVEGSLSHG